MSELQGARADYIFTTKILLLSGEELRKKYDESEIKTDDGVEYKDIEITDEEARDWIILKEPDSFDLKNFGDDGKQNLELLQKVFPKCLIDHSFTDSGTKAKNASVSAMLLDSGTQFSRIIELWMDSLPLKKTNSGKSDS